MRKKKSIRLLIIAFLLAAICACSAVSVYAIVSNSDAKSGDSMLLYEESFDSVTERVDLASGENPGVAGGWTFVKSSDNAKAYIDGGRLHLSGNKYDMVYLTDGNWTNYTLEADMYYKSATSSSGWVGMLYNLQSEKDFQKAGINPNKKYSLNGKVDGSWKNDVSGINKGFSLGDDVTFTEEMPFRIKVVAYNNNAILYYALLDENGAMKSDYVRLLTIDNIPEQTRSGSIGFMTSTNNLASVWVDNIKISNISEDDLLLLEPSVADIYEADTGIVNPPVAVEKITSSLPALDGERAAVVIAELDSELNVIGKDGSVLTTADDFIDTYRKQLIPAFLVDSEAEADALAALMHDKNLTDAYVVAEASNAALVKRVRVANSTTNLITGALIFGDLNSPEARSAARELVVDNMSYVAISTSALTEETAFYFASRQIAAWGFAESTAEVYRGIANGYHGIVSESVSEIYGVYESITEPTVSGRTVVIAHRGVNAGAETPYPENTLMAIRAAKEVYGADCVEIDFGLTKDGYVILMHDTTVDRTTNGTGNFSSFTLEEIKALTVDYVEGKETTVPTLEEALLLAKELDIVLYCHVKTVSDENIAAFSYLVDKHDCRENVLLFTSSLDKYNSAIDRVVTGTGYELVDSPVLIDGIQFTAGNQKLFSSYDNPLDGVIAMRKCLNKYNFQPIFYPYIEQGDMWGEETFYYQLSARGFVNTHSITNGQEYMDSTALTGSGAVGWLTNNPHLCDDYHYAIDLSGENLNLKIGESIDTAKTLKLICGTANVSAGIVQLSGPALNSVNTLAEEGTVTVVYYADRKTDGGSTYRIYSEPIEIEFVPEAENGLKTPYGIIDVEYSDPDVYPFAIFDGNGGFVKGSKLWLGDGGGALGVVYNHLNDNVWNEEDGTLSYDGGEARRAVIYLRRDYDMSTSDVKFNNFGLIKGEFTLDLGGHTLSQGTSSTYLFPLQAKNAYPTTLNVMNGTVLATTKRIVYVVSNSSAGDKRSEINFNGVTFGLEAGSTISGMFYSSGKGSGNTTVCDFYISYNDCIFDLETVAPGGDSFTVFPNATTSNYCKVVTEVNGGELRFNSCSNVTFYASSFTNGSSVTFGKSNGEYTKLILPEGETAPTVTFPTDSGNYIFVKTGSDGEKATYKLQPEAVASLDFTPKMSLTLDRNLILNVYVPAADYLVSYTLDGKASSEYAVKEVEIDGDNYYLVSISLDAKEALRSVVLKATITLGAKTATGTFTFGIVKYAEKILADGTDTEKALVRDVLSYVRAAYTYFDTSDAESVAKINEILGENYDTENAPAIEGSTVANAPDFKSVTFVLDGTPAMRFYLTDGADATKYAFFIDGKRVNTEISEDGKYIDIDVYAYALCETVTYTVDGAEGGSFHINAYYEWSKTQNNENLTNLVARFWKYLQSARAYRDSVVEN